MFQCAPAGKRVLAATVMLPTFLLSTAFLSTLLLPTLLLSAVLLPTTTVQADEEPAPARPAAFLKLTSPLNEQQFGRVQRAALNLQTEALEQERQAVLILEVPEGTTQFHQVYGLAKFLTSPELSQVVTVAWVPETVTGNNVVLALGCNEVILHPEAELGDIGRGKPVDADEQEQIKTLVEKGQNPRLNVAVALKMIDPQRQLSRIRVKPRPDAQAVTEFVTAEQLRVKQDARAIIEENVLLIDTGAVGLFNGRTARTDWDVLVTHTAANRAALAELYDLPLAALRDDPASATDLKVWLIEIEGPIDDFTRSVVTRHLARATSRGANTIIFRIDSPGGEIGAMQDIANSIADLDPADVRTVAWIPREAISAAAVIATACDEIYLKEDAIIGDAGAIQFANGVVNNAPEKIVSMMREVLRKLAEKKGRPPALMMAMTDKNLEVYEVRHRDTGRIWYLSQSEIDKAGGEWIKVRLVPETREGLFLTMKGSRAHELKIAEPPVADMDELKQRLGIGSETPVAVMGENWVDKLVLKLNDPRWWGTLLTLAMLFLFIELHFFTGFFAILSALCFALFFWSRYMGGTAGWLEVMLFGLGVLALGLEVFVIPGFGVFGITGGLLLVVSIVMASQDFGHVEPGRDVALLTRTVSTMTLSVGAVIVIAIALNRFLPHVPFLKGMVLAPPVQNAVGPQLRPDLQEAEGEENLVGVIGTARTTLRPSGKVLIGERLIDVVSNGDYIAAGASVEVMSVNGHRVTVREVS